MNYKKNIKVGILAGGPTSERDVSLRSGFAVYEALKKNGYDAALIELQDFTEKRFKALKVDAAFIALHGGGGEDGTVQAYLEKYSIPYTGSGPKSSYRAMCKLESKRIFKDFNIPVPEYISVNSKISLDNLADFHLPLVIKPAREGSSIGLAIVNEKGLFEKALDEAFKYGDTVIIEKFIDGRELTVGVLGDKALPVVEIRPKSDVYDYKAKYIDNETEYMVPAPVSESEKKEAQSLAIRAHNALGCRDMSRVDIRMDKQGRMYVLEVNTIPGMTSRSLLPKAAEAAGISFRELCDMVLGFAIKRGGSGAAAE